MGVLRGVEDIMGVLRGVEDIMGVLRGLKFYGSFEGG